MTLCIRNAAIADYPVLCELFEQIDRLHRESLSDIFQSASGPPRERSYIRSLINDPDVGMLVAEIADGSTDDSLASESTGRRDIVGCLIVKLRRSPEVPILVPMRYAMVDTLVVSEAFQRRGVGRQLMAAAEAWALRRGISRIELNVFEFNHDAQAFYEHLGYETLSRRMVKRLDSTMNER